MADEVADDTIGNADFNSGFEEAAPSPVIPAQGTEPQQAQAAPKAPEKEPAPQAPAAAAKSAPTPEYVQLSKEDHATLMAAAAKTASFEGQFSKLFGTIGNVQQVIEKLRTQTPTGEKVELPKVALAKLRESFPEVADLLEEDMAEALKGVRGTGPADAPGATLTTEDVQKAAKAMTQAIQMEALAEDHPTWREVVGTVDSEGKYDANNEFRKWLATQPVDYQTKINETDSAAVISKAIDKFLASKKSSEIPVIPAQKVAVRQDRIKSAVQPKGDGGQPPPPKTADDDFHQGFASG